MGKFIIYCSRLDRMVPHIGNYKSRGREIHVFEDTQGNTMGYDLKELETEVARSIGSKAVVLRRFVEGLRSLLPDDWISQGVQEYGRQNLISHPAIITSVNGAHTKMTVENGRNIGGELEVCVTANYNNCIFRLQLTPRDTHNLMYTRGQSRYVDDLIGDHIRVYTTGQGIPKGIGTRLIQEF